VAEKFGHY